MAHFITQAEIYAILPVLLLLLAAWGGVGLFRLLSKYFTPTQLATLTCWISKSAIGLSVLVELRSLRWFYPAEPTTYIFSHAIATDALSSWGWLALLLVFSFIRIERTPQDWFFLLYLVATWISMQAGNFLVWHLAVLWQSILLLILFPPSSLPTWFLGLRLFFQTILWLLPSLYLETIEIGSFFSLPSVWIKILGIACLGCAHLPGIYCSYPRKGVFNGRLILQNMAVLHIGQWLGLLLTALRWFACF